VRGKDSPLIGGEVMADEEERDEFSVVVFYKNDAYEYVRRFVDGRDAVETFKRMTESVDAHTGLVAKVIITDGGGFTNFMWEFGKGITFPAIHY
jgi:hypothetical protein